MVELGRRAYFILCVLVVPSVLVIGAVVLTGLSGGAAVGLLVPLMLCGVVAYWRGSLNNEGS